MSDIDSDTASVPAEEQQTLALVHQLIQSFQNGQSGMVFACGGKVPIPVANNTAQPTPMKLGSAPTCPPVILRWDPSSNSVPASECKLKFPLDHSDNTTAHNMHQLLRDMQPATFGYQGQDVLDESYRKASKLDPSHFACTFSPHEMGIVDDIARILLPGFEDKTTWDKNKTVCEPHIERLSAMRAELYKLNVYAGPSGHFKAHVDTPRSTDQIGSLVVCLPSIHQGGQLEVRHEGRIMTFDWSMPETVRPEIQWAAFYSDCEHEVLEVTSGHRITLAYNLYASSSTGSPRVGNGLMDPTQLPLYNILHSLFLQESFMPDGGYLGFHTSHAYPHTSKSARLPSTLKGADMIAWETFRSLGCGVRLRPVADMREGHYGHEDSEPCPAEDLTDTSSEGYRSDTPDELNSSEESDGDQVMAEESGPPLSSADHSVADTDDAHAAQDDDGDQPMDERPVASAVDPERWIIDAGEVEALQEEAKEIQSLPKTDFQGIEPSGRLLPRRKSDERDEEVITALFEKIGDRGGCRALGNGLSFLPTLRLIEDVSEEAEILDYWMAQKPRKQELTGKQPDRVLYGDVAWLNRSGLHKEPQISYGVVSCPR